MHASLRGFGAGLMESIRSHGRHHPHHHERHHGPHHGDQHPHHFGGHHGPHHGRGFGAGRHGGPGGDDSLAGFGAGRKIGSADLQLVILALLAERPRHGYELIKAIDERSQGYYVPSPGVIYPALSYLDETGLAEAAAEGTKKLYSVTEAGQAHLAQNRAAVDAMLAQLSKLGERMAQVREAMTSEGPDAAWTSRGRGRSSSRSQMSEPLQAAIGALRSAVHAAGDEAEQRRVAEVLNRAVQEILQGRPVGK